MLTVRDDAGASTDVFVAPYSDPAACAPFYAVVAKDVSTAQAIGARAGPGCGQRASSVVCPCASVQALALEAGDGADRLIIGGAAPGRPGTAQVSAVPVTVDAGSGDDGTGVFCAGQPVVLRGGWKRPVVGTGRGSSLQGDGDAAEAASA